MTAGEEAARADWQLGERCIVGVLVDVVVTSHRASYVSDSLPTLDNSVLLLCGRHVIYSHVIGAPPGGESCNQKVIKQLPSESAYPVREVRLAIGGGGR